MIDTSAALAKFRQAAEARGLFLPDRIDADGKLHRCDVTGGAKGKKDGAYLLHLDGVPAGGFENHRDGLGWETWKADIGRRLTPEEEAAQRRIIEAQQAEREAEAKAKRDKARKRAHGLWNSAKPAPEDHPYLVRKGVAPWGLRVGSWPKWTQGRDGAWEESRIPGVLLVPMRSASGTLHSLQAIYAEKVDGRDKDFLPHGEKTGKFHLIGGLAEGLPLCVAEGFATGASIHQATGWPVAIAFDAGNLVEVAPALRAAYPEVVLIVCADDDAFGHCMACKAPVRVSDGVVCPACGKDHRCGNAGRLRAVEAAQAARGVVAVPEFMDPAGRWQGYQESGKAPTDFNDLATSAAPGEGLEAVRRILHAAFASVSAVPEPVPCDAPEPAAADSEAVLPQPAANEPKPAKRTRASRGSKPKAVQASAQQGEKLAMSPLAVEPSRGGRALTSESETARGAP
ncbi:toprim domain-containing protein [Aromatoleum anaerobium]|uniref:Toprim domain-containing protein n=1 Tax=Aromatoleum anaerobium TaxID=182180 RepID=A0ABX1PQ57_9RHOO|nr:toprim domain-containing protein [Aromatoleum anaerobium]MCK0507373.1 toprim domain-containing protein [Aromatoleum anaerobium]